MSRVFVPKNLFVGVESWMVAVVMVANEDDYYVSETV